MFCRVCHKDNHPEAEVCEFCGVPMAEDPSSFQPTVPVGGTVVLDSGFQQGSLIAGRYLVERELGRGGMGVVYQVTDQKLHGKDMALKLISSDLIANPQAKGRFVQEVLAVQDLTHPNIVKVFHLDEVDGQNFFTMEYLPGRSLREIITERFASGAKFSLEECESILQPVLKALQYSHSQPSPVIHRDIKPDNVIVSGSLSSPQIKVLDFGLAKILAPSQHTSTAMTMGTAYYMAPEQMQAGKDIDQRADLYSVGVMLYEMLTGEIPSGRFALPGELNPALPAAIDELIDKALQQQPVKRHASAQEFAEALKAAGAPEETAIEEPVSEDEEEFQAPYAAEAAPSYAEAEISSAWSDEPADREEAIFSEDRGEHNENNDKFSRNSINISEIGEEKSFVARLYSGDFGFVKTFWIYFFAANLLFSALSAVNLQLSVFVNLMAFFYFIFIAICIWNSSKKFEGKIIWVWIGMAYIGLQSVQKLVKSFHVIGILSNL